MDQKRRTLNARVTLLSEDRKLRTALSAVIGPEFSFSPAPLDRRIWQLPASELAEVFIFDLNSAHDAAAAGKPPFSYDHFAEDLATFVSSILATGVPVIVMANDDLRGEARDLVEQGAQSHVRNPPVISDLKAALARAYESGQLKRDLDAARQRLECLTGLDHLTGASAPMQQVYKMIRKVASLDASVLITGESGTGKELIARAIHNTGSRASRPFVPVSCSAIPETLIEAELFGHEKGAFTGTIGTREGYFEKAGDGTLFLDEIGELKPHIQVKLLRALQEREFSRLGSSRAIPLRARVVLATHRDLAALVTEGQFRQDLFYRINVVNIIAPELRRRPADIPVLAQHFLMKYSELFNKPVESIEPDALALLQKHHWPGNVRELENVIQRAVILAEGYSLQISDLPEHIQDVEMSAICDDDLIPSGSFERLLREYKIKLAVEAVQQCHGNKTMAAQTLSISRAYLHRLLRPEMMVVGSAHVTEMRPHVCA